MLFRYSIHINRPCSILNCNKYISCFNNATHKSILIFPSTSWGSEFSSYEICETQLHKMTSLFQLLNRKFSNKFFFRVINSTLLNIKLNFQLLTRSFNFYFSTFQLLKLRNKKLHFELKYEKLNLKLLNQNWKIKFFTSSCLLEDLAFSFLLLGY